MRREWTYESPSNEHAFMYGMNYAIDMLSNRMNYGENEQKSL